MGQSTNGLIAYGYDLGSHDEWKVQETDEYGILDVDWYDEDDEETSDLIDAAEKRLLAAAGFTETWQPGAGAAYFDRERAAKTAIGVTFEMYGHHDYCGYMLVATESLMRNISGSPATLDPASIAAAPTGTWDQKLTDALRTLGLTPTQAAPAWLLASYYG